MLDLEKRPCEGLVARQKKASIIRSFAAHNLFCISSFSKVKVTVEVINVKDMLLVKSESCAIKFALLLLGVDTLIKSTKGSLGN